MSEPYTGSYQEDTRVLFFDNAVKAELFERAIKYEPDYKNGAVTITIPDNGETIEEVLNDLGIPDLYDHYLYSHYNVDANVPENLQEV